MGSSPLLIKNMLNENSLDTDRVKSLFELNPLKTCPECNHADCVCGIPKPKKNKSSVIVEMAVIKERKQDRALRRLQKIFGEDQPLCQIIASDDQPTSMKDCSKFEACSVNICPLDSDWRKRTHLQGEPSCHYLRLHVKDAATDEEQSRPAFQAAVSMWKHKDELPPTLVKQVEKSALFKRKTMPTQQAA